METKISELTNLTTYLLLLVFLAGVGLLGLLGLGYVILQWWRHRDREQRSLESVLLEVRLPRDNEIKIDAAEQMFASLYSVKKTDWLRWIKSEDHLSVEIVARKEDIRFYLSCHKDLQDLVEKQVHGAYPGAEVKVVDEYNIFSEEGKVAYAQLVLKRASHLPIKAYRDLPTDPLSSVTSALAKMGEGEGAVVQVLVSPATAGWQQAGRAYIAKVKGKEEDPEKAQYKVEQKALEQIDTKIGKPGFHTVVRIVVAATTAEQAKAHLSNIKGTWEQFTSDQNSFKKQRIWFKKFFMIDFIYRYMPMLVRPGVLSADEVATVFHWPNKMVETPHIKWLPAKRAPAPAEIPQTGLYLGKSAYRGISRPVYIGEDDRRRHIYIIGKTGTGKSELLKDMILQDIRAGKGVCLIDPHDTVEKLLELIPAERAEDVIYFDPSDTERPMGLNMLEADTEEQQHFVVSSIIGLMYKLYDPHRTGIIGPRFEHAIRNAMLTIMSKQGSTFIELVRTLTDPKYVEEMLPYVKDPVVKRYWTDQIAQTSDFHKSEVLDYIVSKFGRFVTNKTMRNIIGQPSSAFNFRQAMDEKKIILCNLSKGILGEEDAKFLGLILVPKVLTAAMSRADVPMDQRQDFFLYVDEFQNFATEDFAVILAEARKYKLNLIVANQYIAQIEEDVKNAVFGNVGTLITFRVGVHDANFLQHEFTPTFNESDLTNIEKYHVYIKTIVNNEPVPAFSMSLEKDMVAVKARMNIKQAEMIRELSRLKYGRDRDIVEAEIQQRSNL